MEKKGEILNQLAIISDLLENANIGTETKSVVFVMKKPDFDAMYDIVVKKSNAVTSESIKTTFSMKIGTVDFAFALAKD